MKKRNLLFPVLTALLAVVCLAMGVLLLRNQMRIENRAKNHYTMVVEMYLKDTGEQIYQSGGIKPGYFLEKDRLDTVLPKGEYPVTVTFKAYDEKDQYIGEANAETKIRIRS